MPFPQTPDPHSILLMGFGQSNADVHDAGPRLAIEIEDAMPIFMPNDGKMIRGHMGKYTRDTPITGFDHISTSPPTVQSLLVATAARLLHDLGDAVPDRVIVRTEARGGRRFLGIEKNGVLIDGIYRNHDGAYSIIFDYLMTTIRECIAAAQADNCPIRLINMVWLHGESDRALTREVYHDLFLTLIDDVESRLADTGIAIHWTVVQPSGTGAEGNGNAWPNRLAIFDLADKRANIDVPVTGYAFAQHDASHYSAEGKLLLGESLGRAIAQRLTGTGSPLPQPVRAEIDDCDVVLTIAADAPIVLDTQMLPQPDITLQGFSSHDKHNAILQEVTVEGPRQLRLRFNSAPDPATLMIHYAYRNRNRVEVSQDVHYPAGRGCLRTTWSAPSCLMTGRHIYDWAAGFSIRVADLVLHDTKDDA
ncbi:hypothetical protein [Loktanella salsilacus]|uniref:hypothetical protein n=1 Tax=Loktanella salsilacus TaxID=195913 RepID=UPI0035667574